MKKNSPETAPAFFPVEARWRAAAPWGLWALWAATVAVIYFRQGRTPVFSLDMWLRIFPPLYEMTWTSLSRHLAVAARAALFIGLAWGSGRCILLRFFRLGGLNPLES